MKATSHLYLVHHFLEKRQNHVPKGNKQKRFCKDAKATTCMHNLPKFTGIFVSSRTVVGGSTI